MTGLDGTYELFSLVNHVCAHTHTYTGMLGSWKSDGKARLVLGLSRTKGVGVLRGKRAEL